MHEIKNCVKEFGEGFVEGVAIGATGTIIVHFLLSLIKHKAMF